MTIKELQEKRGTAYDAIKELRDVLVKEDRDFTPEEQVKWEECNADYDQLTNRIDMLQATEKIDDQMNRADVPVMKPETTEAPKPLTDEQRSQAMRYFWTGGEQGNAELAQRFGLNRNEIEISLRADANQSAQDGSLGGYTVPTSMANSVIESMSAFGGMRQVCTIMQTAGGEPYNMPTSDDTSNTGEQVGENAAVSVQEITFGQKTLGSYLFSSKEVKVPVSLLQDSAINLDAFIGNALGTRIGRITNTRYTTGTGAATIAGVTVDATTGKTTASSTAFTISEIYDLIHSVDPAYRSSPNCRLMMNDAILLAARKLVDGNGQYLWQPSVQAGVPSTLAGYQYTINQDMASTITSSDITMLFGDFSKYIIRDVATARLRRLVERHAENDQVAFILFFRTDGLLTDTAAVKTMVQA